jgi:cytidylate kinase
MTEDRISELDDMIEESFGLHPSRWVLVRKTSETILHLANLGNVILIGRGANIVTRKLPRVFHVRLIGSLDRRVERLREEHPQGEKAALKFLRAEDKSRRRYLKKYFGKDADDPTLYHLVINTDLVSPETAATMIGNAVLERRA